jgi:3-methyladenine DNA glycosylase/8-oxoguanine DNA glycosylase
VRQQRFRLRGPLDLRLTLAPLRCGATDPTFRFQGATAWRATRTADGPATVRLWLEGDEVVGQAWGPGAERALDGLPALVGAADDTSGFRAAHPLVQELARRMPGLRIPHSGAVMELLVPTILEQKVIGKEARRSWAGLVRALGEPAPGPEGLLLAPSPAVLAATPYFAFHRFDVERRRADTVRRAATHARRLEEATAMAPDDARRRLCALPGLGPWSAAKVALAALGDADAVAVGDYHLPHLVCWALAGEPRGDDARMLELLEPYRGHRGRVTRLLMAGGVQAPRYGPRMALHPIRDL